MCSSTGVAYIAHREGKDRFVHRSAPRKPPPALVGPAVGTTKAYKVDRSQVGKLHSSLAVTPFQANRVLAVVSSMYAFAGRAGIVPESTNPARGIDKFKESRRERFLTGDELERLGSAIREAEATGIPWTVDEAKPTAKHVPKAKRVTKIAPSAAAALRLLLFTGCRLREILHLRLARRLSSVAVFSCQTARPAGRPSSSMRLPLRC